MKAIPSHEPEVIAAGTRRNWGDVEKVATTSVRDLTMHGIHLSSRYDKAFELELMRRMVEAISPHLRKHVASIFCDSKANACYSITFNRPPKAIGERILDQIEEAAGGHNGIWVNDCDAKTRDPYWPGDYQ